jgi:phospho-N-acetylmuramoyl-pentapeptide-transferase
LPFDILLLLITAIIAAGLVLVAGSSALGWLREHGCKQHIRDDGPQQHLVKSGTPTMGGVLFVPVAILVGLAMPAFTGEWHFRVLLLAGLVLAFMLIGLADDGLMLKRKASLGLKARHKLLLQFLCAGLFLVVWNSVAPMEGVRLPFTVLLLDPMSGWVYYPIALLLIVGTSNATNLTDGLDGLLTGITVIVAVAFALIALWLNRMDIALFACAVLGACLGFLYYNRHPARVFMGDTGSLAIGAALTGIAMMLHAEIFLLLFGVVYYIEALSVMIQVAYFKRTGRRIFKMSPIHHHFELSGWSETRVVRTFWSVTATMCALVLIGTHIGWRL